MDLKTAVKFFVSHLKKKNLLNLLLCRFVLYILVKKFLNEIVLSSFFADIQKLLASLDQICQKVESRQSDVIFLRDLLQNHSFQALILVSLANFF